MFRPGKLAGKPDALSRREQDIPKDASDERLQHRVAQLFKPEVLSTTEPSSYAAPVNPQPAEPDEERPCIENLWTTAVEQDRSFKEIKDAISRGDRRFPSQLKLQVTIAECSLDNKGRPRFRERL